jgi:hypothetical protein
MTDSLPRAAEAGHLTAALRRCGALGNGRVCQVAMESSRDTILSRVIRLRLTYEGTADEAPKSVILKTGLPQRAGSGWNAGRQEVAFYAEVASATRTRLVPRCFEAHWDADQNTWHLLLEDLTDSHAIATAWPLPPTFEQCQMIVRARARFHAEWWDDGRLGTTVGVRLDGDAVKRYLERLADELKRFADRLGDRLPRDRRQLYGRLLREGPRLFTRYRSQRNVTIVQGDAHVWNCFLPKTGGSEDVRFFDWDSWEIGIGSDDLAYMMAMHWYPDRRQRLERPLLDLYHTTLGANGIAYDREALDEDYRLSVLWQITTPIWQARNNIPAVIWWNNLERILSAVDDLGCRDLLT